MFIELVRPEVMIYCRLVTLSILIGFQHGSLIELVMTILAESIG